jgi:hypothetical protein
MDTEFYKEKSPGLVSGLFALAVTLNCFQAQFPRLMNGIEGITTFRIHP